MSKLGEEGEREDKELVSFFLPSMVVGLGVYKGGQVRGGREDEKIVNVLFHIIYGSGFI